MFILLHFFHAQNAQFCYLLHKCKYQKKSTLKKQFFEKHLKLENILSLSKNMRTKFSADSKFQREIIKIQIPRKKVRLQQWYMYKMVHCTKQIVDINNIL
eukprot:TRINITY_DN6171_c0_g1_i2.p8 TRINITY_DN6171_c0_g1~~TRINITY_DN6171_c0_g1_i2.p8  ORF type:complete len:100 (-),score=2.13 TRINITY_DN6171_c0_g1_i2:130-429(-)